MATSGGTGLVLLSGSSAGSGKSTVMRGLAAKLRRLGAVLEVTEDDVWGKREFGRAPVDRSTASPLFLDLLHSGSSRNISPESILGAFHQLQQEAVHRSAMWLQDWSWHELVAMLGWRWEMRQQTLRWLGELSKPLSPLVIYLQVDRQVALHRALEARGVVWFNRYAGRSLDEPVTSFDVREVAAAKRGVESARKAELVGWPVTVVDGSGTPADVVDAAWQAVKDRFDIDGPA